MLSCIIHIDPNGKLLNRKAVEKFFAAHRVGGKYEWTSKKVGKRTLPQNKYYWSVVVGMIKDRLIELGNDVDSQVVHDFLKDRFNSKELFTNEGTVIGHVGDTTTKLTTSEFDEYLEKCKRFASEALDIFIPDPQKQSELFLIAHHDPSGATIVEMGRA